MTRINRIESELNDLRAQLQKHRLYTQLADLEDIKIFMEWHVFAVWDFMSLLKSLQQQLTCVRIPWVPASNVTLSRFINEIVHGEESDLDFDGQPSSHFEMYLQAMKEIGASTSTIEDFVKNADSVQAVYSQLEIPEIPYEIKDFVNFTFQVIESGETHRIASAFTYGREDVIPDMFLEIINGKEHPGASTKLEYYLRRHIELDGDEHGPLSLKMISELCGDNENKWKEAGETAREALKKRVALWDGISKAMETRLEKIAG